jgi:hypothetical protein
VEAKLIEKMYENVLYIFSINSPHPYPPSYMRVGGGRIFRKNVLYIFFINSRVGGGELIEKNRENVLYIFSINSPSPYPPTLIYEVIENMYYRRGN